MDDTALDPWHLRAALAGDAAAWSRLIDEFGGTIWHWARSQGLRFEDAEDVCQTVWYVLKDKGHTIEDPRRLPGWLATTTRREAQMVSKKRSRDEPTIVDDTFEWTPADARPGPDVVTEVSDMQARLAAAFNGLKARCKELLSLLWADLHYNEVAEILGMAIGSIGETRRRCLQELRVRAGVA